MHSKSSPTVKPTLASEGRSRLDSARAFDRAGSTAPEDQHTARSSHRERGRTAAKPAAEPPGKITAGFGSVTSHNLMKLVAARKRCICHVPGTLYG